MEDLTFAAADGVALAGTLETPKKAGDSCVILCHGVTVDREEGGVFARLARDLAAMGLPSFRFDFRGHGKSGSTFEEMTVAGEMQDVRAAIALMAKRGYKRLALVAASFAGGPVAYVAAEWPAGVRALVLWNSVLDFNIPFFKKRHERPIVVDGVEHRLNPAVLEAIPANPPGEALLEAGLPACFIHGDKDESLPCDVSVKYSAMIPGAEMITIRGSGHGFHEQKYAKEACAAAVEFLKKQLGR